MQGSTHDTFPLLSDPKAPDFLAYSEPRGIPQSPEEVESHHLKDVNKQRLKYSTATSYVGDPRTYSRATLCLNLLIILFIIICLSAPNWYSYATRSQSFHIGIFMSCPEGVSFQWLFLSFTHCGRTLALGSVQAWELTMYPWIAQN